MDDDPPREGAWAVAWDARPRVAPLIGSQRPGLDEDLGERFLRALLNAEVAVACLLVAPGDPLIRVAQELDVEVLPLPLELCATRSRICKALACPRFRCQLHAWLQRFEAYQPQLGFLFYSWWVPPELYQVPQYGTINYHPAPLPQMRGFEPDTAAVLFGLPSAYGTIHRVDWGFDTGDILWETTPIELTPWDTPPSVLDKVTRSGIAELSSFFRAVGSGEIHARKQDSAAAGDMELRFLAHESVIDWQRDDHAAIERRNRAFNGQSWRVRLRARIGATGLCCIRRIATLAGDFPGEVGAVLGRYPDAQEGSAQDAAFGGATLVRTLEGVAACVIDHECSAVGAACLHTGRCLARNPEVVPPGLAQSGLIRARLERALHAPPH